MRENKINVRNIVSKWGSVVVLLLVLILFCMYFQSIKNYFEAKNGTLGTWDHKYTLFNLVKQHLYVTCISSIISLVIGGAMGLFCTSAAGRDLKGIMEKLTYLGQMIPSIAMLTFLVPIFGMNEKPAIVALTVMGILPIYIGFVTGVESVPEDVLEVAHGLGMPPNVILRTIILPLALPIIISGIRMSLIINVSAATLASKVGGGGLGILLLNSLRTGDTVQILEGTIPVCLLAIIIDRTLKNIEDLFSAKTHSVPAAQSS